MGSIDIQELDIVIVGAGLSGLCSLHHIRKQFPSWRIRILEAGPSLGGTWLFNRYPGARVDTESLSYAFSFDKELLDEWNWTDEFATQEDTLRYIERFAEKHELRSDIQFNTRVKFARWDDRDHSWMLADTNGFQYKTRFFISCIGFLSSPVLPKISGIEDFLGQAYHTSRWPKDFEMSRDFADKRIGVIGTGATGIQTITAVSKEPGIRSLSVFQRTANWSAPLRNKEISPEQMAKYKKEYDGIFLKCSEAPSGFLHKADPRKSSEVSDEERVALWEKLYSEPGFGKWIGTFRDTYTDREANGLYSDFMAAKIRARVHDPATAERLVPKNHGFGTRRVPLESGYFEVYNQPNVHLVDLQETPIQRVTPNGIITSDGKEHELDVLILATGFNAITGAFSEIDWHAKKDRPLIARKSSEQQSKRAIWADHRPSTFLGLLVPDLPNTFVVLGPHQPFGNAPRSIEFAVQVVCELLQFCADNHYTSVEPKQDAVDKWTEHVVDCSKGQLANEVDSWMTGVNTNVEGKAVRHVARYTGSYQQYRQKCRDCTSSGWVELDFA
jgi:cation diffusion facilitator CzcD-associated flavoprotein CzcO